MAELDMQTLLAEVANSDQEVALQAMTRFQTSESYQARQVQRIQDLHHYYNPEDGDQWPADKRKRPGKIHMTVNIVKAAVDVDARLQSIMPRITIPQANLSPKERRRAEGTEQMMLEWLERSGVETWLNVLCQVKSLYGKGVLRPYWDKKLKRPDVTVVENPANLRLGYGDSDYTRLDWSIYEYGISMIEAKNRWPDLEIHPGKDAYGPPTINMGGTDHADPLDQRVDDFFKPRYREYSEYEKGQLKVWDYWYRGKKGVITNAVLANGVIVEGPHEHKYLPDIPYIVIENDHEPGNPEGVSTVATILDIQEEFNRLISHGLQHIADDVDPSWFLTGPSADAVPPGLIPKAGKVVGAGDNEVKLIPKGVNTFPISEMIAELWDNFHKLTGLPEILFGRTPGADTSGRAIAIQVEAASNRLDPRRRRLYQGLRELMIFWTIMTEKKNPKVSIGVPEPDPEQPGVEPSRELGEVGPHQDRLEIAGERAEQDELVVAFEPMRCLERVADDRLRPPLQQLREHVAVPLDRVQPGLREARARDPLEVPAPVHRDRHVGVVECIEAARCVGLVHQGDGSAGRDRDAEPARQRAVSSQRDTAHRELELVP